MRRFSSVTVSVLLVGSLLAGCGTKETTLKPQPSPQAPAAPAPAAPAAKPKPEVSKIRLGLASPAIAFLPVYVADKLGYFKEEGLTVELFTFSRGKDAVSAMIAGELDINSGGFSEPMDAQVAGQDIKAFYGTTNVIVYQWYGKKEITKPDQLKGKKIAIAGLGGQTHMLTNFWLRKYGLDPAKDVQLVSAGGNRAPALISGQVDAALLSTPDKFVAKRAGMTLLGDLNDYLKGFPHDVYYAKQDFLKKNPETVRAFIRALNKASQKVRDDKATAMKIAEEYVKLKPEDLEPAWEEVKDTFPLDGTIALEGADFIMDMAIEAGDLKAKLPHEKVIDFTYIKEFAKK